jgi:hypothetical protein
MTTEKELRSTRDLFAKLSVAILVKWGWGDRSDRLVAYRLTDRALGAGDR